MSRAGRIATAAVWIAGIIALVALGNWQVRRLAWKHALIAQVEARLAAAAVPPPRNARPTDAYRRVRAIGTFASGSDSFVQANTVRGPGWWVMTPLHTAGGRTILINRGYAAKRTAPPPSSRLAIVTGLLRLTEPGGGFLRHNDPAADRWYSRDVAAIAARRGLVAVAPYFIDADAASATSGLTGGLTVVHFPNNHLPYAITWYTLAAMATAGLIFWVRSRRMPA